jgi:hypothetical protein
MPTPRRNSLSWRRLHPIRRDNSFTLKRPRLPGTGAGPVSRGSPGRAQGAARYPRLSLSSLPAAKPILESRPSARQRSAVVADESVSSSGRRGSGRRLRDEPDAHRRTLPPGELGGPRHLSDDKLEGCFSRRPGASNGEGFAEVEDPLHSRRAGPVPARRRKRDVRRERTRRTRRTVSAPGPAGARSSSSRTCPEDLTSLGRFASLGMTNRYSRARCRRGGGLRRANPPHVASLVR